MQQVYLIRHATPAIQPTVPTVEWRLSDRGIDEARRLARIAESWGLQAIYSSIEPKAEATALLIAESQLMPVHVTEGFDELRFDQWIGNADEFSEAVRDILANPEVSMRGAERADSAATRFASGIEIVRAGPFPAAIVSHGRIITSYLAQALALEDAFATWRSIPMPGWCALDVEGDRPRLLSPFEGLPPV